MKTTKTTKAAITLLETNGLSLEKALQLGLTGKGGNGITVPDVKRFLLAYTEEEETSNDFFVFEEEEVTIATAPTIELWNFCCYAAQFRNFTAADIYAQGIAMGIRTVEDVISTNPFGIYSDLAVKFRNQK